MPFRPAIIPASIPILALIAGLPFANRIDPIILGLPFLLFWILAWVVVTPLFIGLAYLLDGSEGESDTKAQDRRDVR